MKVRELIEKLEQQNPDDEVVFTYNYGDRSRTTVAPSVKDVDTLHVKRSNYHEMDVVVDDEDDDGRMVVAIS